MRVTVIIPTLCEKSRSQALLRAIESIHNASEEKVRLLIVVNGQRFDPELLECLKGRDDLDVIQIAEGSLTAAHLIGRQAVSTEFFSFLDDDDEYMPMALDVRLSLFGNNPDLDVVVTNGFSCGGGGERLTYSRLSLIGDNPLYELFQENWLHNCNHLFRSASVPIGYFENPHPYMEWTWLGFRLAIDGKKILAVNVPTFKYNNTPGSLSKSTKFVASRIGLYQRMLGSPVKRDISNLIKKRLCSAWHDLSVAELQSGNRGAAFSAHIRCLMSHIDGMKYLSYTRYFWR